MTHTLGASLSGQRMFLLPKETASRRECSHCLSWKWFRAEMVIFYRFVFFCDLSIFPGEAIQHLLGMTLLNSL